MKNLLYIFATFVILSGCSETKKTNTDSIIPRPVSVEKSVRAFQNRLIDQTVYQFGRKRERLYSQLFQTFESQFAANQ